MRLLRALLVAAIAQAGVLDRVAVTAGKDVITESEVLEEIRVTDFLNQAPLDRGPEARRAAAERLVDQYLIRNEMRLEGFPQPQASAADPTLRQFRQDHFHTAAPYQASLQKYGITEAELKQHLLWQVAAMRFTQQRFAPGSKEMDAWLKQIRSQTRIDFRQEAFQ
jgi:hypothetical protein